MHKTAHPPTQEPESKSEQGLGRIMAFSDGVFAIAVTLLVLEVIKVPSGLDNAQLYAALLALGPRYLSYVIGFLVIGGFWMSHHRMFRHIERFDGRLQWLNMLLLMVVAFLPFPTALLGEYGDTPTAVIFYALCLIAMGLLHAALWAYASFRYRLISRTTRPGEVRLITWRSLAVPAIFALSIPIAQLSPFWAEYSWILVAPVVALLNRIAGRR